MYMTDQEYYNKWSELHQQNLKRSLISSKDFDVKEYYDFRRELQDFSLQQYQQQQAEKALAKEIEEKLSDCVESALADLLKDFDGNINIEL